MIIVKDFTMKKSLVLFMLLFTAKTAFANPTAFPPFPPFGDISSFIIIGGALLVEVCLVTLFLFFFNMAVKPLFWALFLGNLLIYHVLFLPLLDSLPNTWTAELLIVIADGIMIKLICLCEIFQDIEFRGLKWKYAFIASFLGNLFSYAFGAVIL